MSHVFATLVVLALAPAALAAPKAPARTLQDVEAVIANAGAIEISVTEGSPLIDTKGTRHLVTLSPILNYRLAAGESAACLDHQFPDLDRETVEPRKQIYKPDPTDSREQLKEPTMIVYIAGTALQPEAQVISIPKTQVFELKSKKKSKHPQFCLFELTKAELNPEILYSNPTVIYTSRYGRSMWGETLPIVTTEADNASTTAIDYSAETVGWHGTYVRFKDENPAITVGPSGKATAVFSWSAPVSNQ